MAQDRRDYHREWQRRDRKLNPQKYRDKNNLARHRARVRAFLQAPRVCFEMDTAAMIRATAFENAYAEYEAWFASLDEADS